VVSKTSFDLYWDFLASSGVQSIKGHRLKRISKIETGNRNHSIFICTKIDLSIVYDHAPDSYWTSNCASIVSIKIVSSRSFWFMTLLPVLSSTISQNRYCFGLSHCHCQWYGINHITRYLNDYQTLSLFLNWTFRITFVKNWVQQISLFHCVSRVKLRFLHISGLCIVVRFACVPSHAFGVSWSTILE